MRINKAYQAMPADGAGAGEERAVTGLALELGSQPRSEPVRYSSGGLIARHARAGE